MDIESMDYVRAVCNLKEWRIIGYIIIRIKWNGKIKVMVQKDLFWDKFNWCVEAVREGTHNRLYHCTATYCSCCQEKSRIHQPKHKIIYVSMYLVYT